MAISVTLTFPEKVIEKIDKDRQDINRSKYVLRLIEQAYDLRPRQSRHEDKILRQTHQEGVSHSYDRSAKVICDCTKTASESDPGYE